MLYLFIVRSQMRQKYRVLWKNGEDRLDRVIVYSLCYNYSSEFCYGGLLYTIYNVNLTQVIVNFSNRPL